MKKMLSVFALSIFLSPFYVSDAEAATIEKHLMTFWPVNFTDYYFFTYLFSCFFTLKGPDQEAREHSIRSTS